MIPRSGGGFFCLSITAALFKKIVFQNLGVYQFHLPLPSQKTGWLRMLLYLEKFFQDFLPK